MMAGSGRTLPAATRARLLDEHEALRLRLARAEAMAKAMHEGFAVREEFREAVSALASTLARHNLHEEALLEPLLLLGDEMAPARVARMREEHAGEHAALRVALAEEDLATLAAALPDLAEELRAHMEAEERTFLHPQVLR
jgi:iron-sulfur cluster repair protein YtfE (RIC family)